MSQFADYESASENYDHGRRAAGADVIVGMMQVHLQKDIKVSMYIRMINTFLSILSLLVLFLMKNS